MGEDNNFPCQGWDGIVRLGIPNCAALTEPKELLDNTLGHRAAPGDGSGAGPFQLSLFCDPVIALDLTEFCKSWPKQAVARFAWSVVQTISESLSLEEQKLKHLAFPSVQGWISRLFSPAMCFLSDICFCYAQDVLMSHQQYWVSKSCSLSRVSKKSSLRNLTRLSSFVSVYNKDLSLKEWVT